MLNTLVHNMSIHKGSQWLVHVRTVVVVYEHNGPPCKEIVINDIKCENH